MEEKKTNVKKGIRLSLRLYFSLVSIVTLCLSCLLACAIVCTVIVLFVKVPLTISIMLAGCFTVCILTMLIGGSFLWMGTIHLIKPLKEIGDAVKKITAGHFNIRIPRTGKYRGEYEYSNEIDELAENFNTMARELNNMDYMSKDFISNVSHEIKTPVAAITGFTEILLDGNLPVEEQKEYLQLVNEESIRLSKLCEDMLRISRLDNQEIVKKEDEIRIDEQLRKAVILISEKWEQKNMQYELDLEENLIRNNKELLFQIWINLIDNANKYSGDGKTIRIKEYRRKNNIVVEVKDEGIGIPLEKLNKIFDRLYQCDESHKKKGNGLGLSIVKRIVAMLSGEIKCESEVGVGSRFVVTVPISANESYI